MATHDLSTSGMEHGLPWGSPMVAMMPVALLIVSQPDARILVANFHSPAILGTDAEALIGSPLARYFDCPQTIAGLIETARQDRRLAREEALIRGADGRCFRGLVAVQAASADESGNVHVMIIEIGDCLHAEAGHEAESELARVTLASIGEAVMATDLSGFIISMNAEAERRTGWRADQALGLPLDHVFRIVDINTRQPVECPARRAIREAQAVRSDGDVLLIARDGHECAIESSATPIVNADGRMLGAVMVYRDVSDKRSLQERIAWQASHDPLTQLPNRTLLTDRLRQAFAHTQRQGGLLAVCYLDLDGFKPINDQFGHQVGDLVLIQVADRLKGLIRGVDTVARIGGDEFVLLLSDARETTDFLAVLDRLLLEISAPYHLCGHCLQLSASIGVAIYPLDDGDPDTILRHADQAMYQAKQAGRNRYQLFDTERDQALGRHRAELEELRRALATGEFRLHFQPKVNIRTGRVIGAEALIRWQHPQRGLLSPGDFLPAIASTELGEALDNWVIGEALRQMGQWAEQGLTLPVSVNISPDNLQRPGFADRLASCLAAQQRVPASLLELEVLESAALSDMEHVLGVINACHRLGVTFALDDFGTGYSCLAYLRRLPVDGLKIDQSFVQDMLDDSNDLAIVEGVISLAQVFQHRVIAEGVETTEHAVMLMRLGCDLVQGYGIARPMPAADVGDWVRRFAPDPRWSLWADAHWELSNFPLLVAQYDHVRWVKRVVMAVDHPAGQLREDEIADKHACRFGHWYDHHGREHYGQLPEYQGLDSIHSRVHEIGHRMIRLHHEGQTDAARRLSPELLGLKDQILDRLHALQVAVTRSPAAAQP
jgi:diguanylate cyclase (GGDEF)-like protein/PAS domain S-box-containing protein